MKRKLAVLSALVAAVAVVLWADAEAGAQEKTKSPYVHVVIFNLKKDAPKDAVESAIADAHALLTKIPSVRGLRVGRPAEKATPKFASKDYDFGLLVLFENYEGLQEYIDHKMHTDYVERHGKY